ncbi:hypothetical protein SKAU_G00111980 [Synaphobranchus kaupii]|uniref:Uncharacterized protein n=1 Tax=Synaphobranchus kaupii TaxID=118154 RepID=A0A9Q1G1F3_SYNKA|nr:hypothetical protein SKAU_G00111980 [Synaphobranchus kaupii]
MVGNLKHELALVLDICKRKEQRLVAMTHRSEILEEERAELSVKELSAMEGQCERKERELRAMVELFQEQEDRLAAMAFSLQEKEEEEGGPKAALSGKGGERGRLEETVLREAHDAGSLFCNITAARGLPARITEELAQQMESSKLKERVSVLEAEMEEKNIILMAQEEEQRERASMRKKLTEISSELADLKRSATNSTYSHPTAQGIIAVEGECMVQNERASEGGHGKEADSVVEREGSELEGSRQQDIAQNQKPAQEGVHGMQAGGETQTNQGGAQEVLHEGQQTTQHSGQTAFSPGRLPIPFSFALIPLCFPPYDSLCVAERMIAEEWRVGEEEVGEVRGTEDRDGDGDTEQHCDRWRG